MNILDPSPQIPRIPLTIPILTSSQPFFQTKVSTVHLKNASFTMTFICSNFLIASHLALLQVTAEALRGVCTALCDSPSPPLHSQLLFSHSSRHSLGPGFCFLCYEWTLPDKHRVLSLLPSSLCANVTPSKKSSLNDLSLSNFSCFLPLSHSPLFVPLITA